MNEIFYQSGKIEVDYLGDPLRMQLLQHFNSRNQETEGIACPRPRRGQNIQALKGNSRATLLEVWGKSVQEWVAFKMAKRGSRPNHSAQYR